MPDLQSAGCSCPGADAVPELKNIYQSLNKADTPLAMGYVPDQKLETLFPLSEALRVGTIFPGLYKPFCGKGGKFR